MDRRDPSRVGWRDVRSGAAYLAAFTVAALAIFFLDVLQRDLLEGPSLVVSAAEAPGLTPGADVWIAGVRSGRVLSIRFDDPTGPEERRVVVLAVLWHRAVPALRRDAEARIVAGALLAPAVLLIDPGSPAAPPLPAGAALRAVPSVTPDRFAARAAEARAALDTLRSASGRLLSRIERGPGTLSALGRDPSLPARLRRYARRLADLPVEEGGSLRPLLVDADLRAAGRRTAERLAGLVPEEPRTPPQDLAAALGRLHDRLGRLSDGLAAGRGTAGRAVADEELRLQLDRLRASLDSARAELGARPFRWLRVRPF